MGGDDERDGVDEGAVYQSEMPERQRRRRTRFLAGAVGLAAVLGAGAYLVTAQLTDRTESTVTRDADALAPVVPSAQGSTGPATSPPVAGTAPEKPTRSAVRREASPTPTTPSAMPSATGLAAADGPVNEHTVTTADGPVRVVSARFDLTGQRDLLMAGDEGRPVGNARCTQKMRFSNDPSTREVPTMLLCWRTSSERSVVTIAVGANARPSAARSVKLIDSEWKKLG